MSTTLRQALARLGLSLYERGAEWWLLDSDDAVLLVAYDLTEVEDFIAHMAGPLPEGAW